MKTMLLTGAFLGLMNFSVNGSSQTSEFHILPIESKTMTGYAAKNLMESLKNLGAKEIAGGMHHAYLNLTDISCLEHVATGYLECSALQNQDELAPGLGEVKLHSENTEKIQPLMRFLEKNIRGFTIDARLTNYTLTDISCTSIAFPIGDEIDGGIYINDKYACSISGNLKSSEEVSSDCELVGAIDHAVDTSFGLVINGEILIGNLNFAKVVHGAKSRSVSAVLDFGKGDISELEFTIADGGISGQRIRNGVVTHKLFSRDIENAYKPTECVYRAKMKHVSNKYMEEEIAIIF